VKKIIFSIIIVLLFTNISYAKKKYFKENYIFKPDQKIKWLEDVGTWSKNWRTHERISNTPWALRYSKDIVRDGEYSLRFEKRKDDCGPKKNKGDCKRTSEKWIGRSEIVMGYSKTMGETGNQWYSWSIYFPKESNRPKYVDGQVILGQFKTHTKHLSKTREYVTGGKNGNDSNCPELSLTFRLNSEGLMSDRQGVVYCNPWDKDNKSLHKQFYQKLIDIDDIRGKWHDIILHANWIDNDEGFFKIWVNGELKLDYKGKTLSKVMTIDGKKHGPMFRFGVYSQKWSGTTIAYYDSISRADTCEKLIRCNIK
jgi:hypothetical protein